MRGVVTARFDGDAAMTIIDQLARKYTGEPYELREGLVAFTVRPERWHAQAYDQG